MQDEIDVRLYAKLLYSYEQCIKNKAHVKLGSFHRYYEQNIYKLCLSIQKGSYKPWKSQIFVVQNPKPREVIAAHIRDRIVHHYLYNYMNPHWEKKMRLQSIKYRIFFKISSKIIFHKIYLL